MTRQALLSRGGGAPLLLLMVLLAVLVIAGLLASEAGAQPAPATTQMLTYRGVRLSVPAAWPVHDLAGDPRRCVLFNSSAVYLGEEGRDPLCPASAVGVAPALQLRPPTAAAPPAGTAVDNPTAHRIEATSASGSVEATIAYLTRDANVAGVMAQLGVNRMATASHGPTMPAAATPPAATPPRPPSVARAAADGLRPAAAPFPTVSLGFDTCGAPSASTMSTWYASSPYRTVGIYVGGANRACPDGNLSAAWVTSVAAQGWTFIPIYVGLQAPCVFQAGLAPIDPTMADAQGRSAADDAVNQALRFGMRAGIPIYFDSEAYDITVAGCSQTVLAFLSGWTAELHALNFGSGVYGSSASTITDLVNAATAGGITLPDDIWFAHWNDVQTVSDSAYIPDGYWSNHQRIHQYSGGHDESYAGVKINIDGDAVDGDVAIAGNGPPGSLQAFATTSAGQVLTAWQFAPEKPFDPWLGLQIPVPAASSPVTGANQNGSLQLFVRTGDNRLLTSWQAGASRPFGGWVDMGADGQMGSDPATALDGHGAGSVAVRGVDGRVLTTWQSAPNRPYGGWLNLGLPAKAAGRPALAREGNGGIQIFVHTADNRVLTSWQAGAGQPFGGWLSLGLDGQVTGDPAVAASPDGSLSLFAAGANGRVLTSWQAGPSQPFGGWLDLGMPARPLGPLSAIQQANGGLQLFALTTDNRVLTSWQAGAGQPFGGWLNLGLDGQVATVPSAALNADGTMALFARTRAGQVVTSWQAAPNQGFGGWLDLGLPAPALGSPQVAANRTAA